MSKKEQLTAAIQKSYQTDKPVIHLGSAILDGEIISEARVSLPLRMMNRHGLVAGATGSGKTRTLQVFAEQLSAAGVPVFMSDIKGDLSGIAQPGKSNAALEERSQVLGNVFTPKGYPVELYSLSGKKGAQMRATILEFGPILLSKIFELNDTQSGVLAILFKYADDKDLPMVDLNDLKKVLNYLSEGPGAAEIKGDYGSISSSTAGTILRKIVALEQQGVGSIFGERSFDISDLIDRVDGQGIISLLNISDVQDKPALFSTFMLSLLAELYQKLPEAGDLDKPKLVFFLDEAHLLFKDAPKAFLDQIEQVIRLIRSKGVGVFFCTQMAQDVPVSVLSQLGNRVQHVLRAFTPQDADALKQTVKTYPKSSFYEIDQVLTTLGIGQALITVLNEKGIPTEVAATHLLPPTSVMGPMVQADYDQHVQQSSLYQKYKDPVDPESAYEMLTKRMEAHAKAEEETKQEVTEVKKQKEEKGMLSEALNSPLAKQIGREVVRGVFGMLFGKTTRSRTTKKSGGFFGF
ncbi:helicase HerA-like domain-containing protein [Dyadobacter sp. Leaf189]|uniref:helicase HerA-like domain-containing protein n=1 Tax=Dyadobacter sp. Leaf189 TaxID=1736295 RepID=UPI0006F4B4C7|nr:helicase HerA-like domain-containing protein [Dyadobacter sp. Leaf189]KQS33104.1 ATPase [Dyadobacter sp. Leaf189]